ncbi:hypothetical protein BDQ12DRAFT_687982 [Crucibulum laeve]|uniref:Uncharacterized protein n=1 Tax=Crucibulum laeve TaxID=68775 RepID=A0A5C3LRP1_9AGAR|nr:hypothetical protein BDQ12DRAFT_687982 [Crucibulum laeve]
MATNIVQRAASPPLSPTNKRSFSCTDVVRISEGKRRQLSFSSDAPQFVMPLASPSLVSDSAAVDSESRMTNALDKGKGKQKEQPAVAATLPKFKHEATAPTTTENIQDFLSQLARPLRSRSESIPHRPSVRIPTIPSTPSDLYVLRPRDNNSATDIIHSVTSKRERPVPANMFPAFPAAPPGLTRRHSTSEIPRCPGGLNNVGSPFVSSASLPSCSGSTQDADGGRALPVLVVSLPEMCGSEAGPSSLAEVPQDVPPSPTIPHRELPGSSNSSPCSPPPHSPPADDIHDSSWSLRGMLPEARREYRQTYIDFLAKKRVKNPYLPVMPSRLDPIRDNAPPQAWLLLPDLPPTRYASGAGPPRRMKMPLSLYYNSQRSRHNCDRWGNFRHLNDYLRHKAHCRDCNNDTYGKRMLAFRLRYRTFTEYDYSLGMGLEYGAVSPIIPVPRIMKLEEATPEELASNPFEDPDIPESPRLLDLDSFDDMDDDDFDDDKMLSDYDSDDDDDDEITFRRAVPHYQESLKEHGNSGEGIDHPMLM